MIGPDFGQPTPLSEAGVILDAALESFIGNTDNADVLLTAFDRLQPVYTDTDEIEGFTLTVEDETVPNGWRSVPVTEGEMDMARSLFGIARQLRGEANPPVPNAAAAGDLAAASTIVVVDPAVKPDPTASVFPESAPNAHRDPTEPLIPGLRPVPDTEMDEDRLRYVEALRANLDPSGFVTLVQAANERSGMPLSGFVGAIAAFYHRLDVLNFSLLRGDIESANLMAFGISNNALIMTEHLAAIDFKRGDKGQQASVHAFYADMLSLTDATSERFNDPYSRGDTMETVLRDMEEYRRSPEAFRAVNYYPFGPKGSEFSQVIAFWVNFARNIRSVLEQQHVDVEYSIPTYLTD